MNLQDLVQRCKGHCIVLIPDEMKLRMSDLNFRGHLLNKGLRPDLSKVEAFIKMPKP